MNFDTPAEWLRKKKAHSGRPVRCPVCGRGELEQEFYDHCRCCGWTYDRYAYIYQNEVGYNVYSVKALRKAYRKEGDGFTVRKYVQENLKPLRPETDGFGNFTEGL